MSDTVTTRESVDQQELIRRAEALIPALRARAQEAEELRRVPDATIEDIREAGLFQILVPKELGGFGEGLSTYLQVARALARGCMSTAWTVSFLIEHAWQFARFPRAVRDEVFADGPAPLAAGTGAGKATVGRTEGGYLLEGRWSFASAIMHSDWVMLGTDFEGSPYYFVLPIGDVVVHDVWHTSGLKATGSNDVSVDGVFVPEHRVLDLDLFGSPGNPGGQDFPEPIMRYPVSPVLSLISPAFALGAAEHALEVYRELVLTKPAPYTSALQSESTLTQARFARVSGLVETARQQFEESVSLVLARLESHPEQELDALTRSRYKLMIAFTGQSAAEAVRLVTEAAGGSQARLSAPLQRIQRDMNVLMAHRTMSYDLITEQSGRGLLGLDFSIPAVFF